MSTNHFIPDIRTLKHVFQRTLDIETRNDPLSFTESARQSGLYILGKPRMDKSWFMIDLMIKDKNHSHGIFFIDPHGDAIDTLLENFDSYDLQTTILLDPEDPHYSFGINILECDNIADIKARNETFNELKVSSINFGWIRLKINRGYN